MSKNDKDRISSGRAIHGKSEVRFDWEREFLRRGPKHTLVRCFGLVIAVHFNRREGRARPSRATIAAESCLHPSTVSKYTKQLEDLGWLGVISIKGQKWPSNAYQLTIPDEIEKKEQRSPCRPSDDIDDSHPCCPSNDMLRSFTGRQNMSHMSPNEGQQVAPETPLTREHLCEHDYVAQGDVDNPNYSNFLFRKVAKDKQSDIFSVSEYLKAPFSDGTEGIGEMNCQVPPNFLAVPVGVYAEDMPPLSENDERAAEMAEASALRATGVGQLYRLAFPGHGFATQAAFRMA